MFSLHHVSLSVMDLEKSIKFYSCLGFKLVLIWESKDKKNKIAHLKMQNNFLELFYYIDHKLHKNNESLEDDLKTVGIKHFALKVESIKEAEKLFRANGFSNDIQVKLGKTGIKYFFAKDPNGIFLEIVEDNRVF